jgi:hypothetical protein
MVRISKPNQHPISSPVVKPANRTESTEKSSYVRKEKQEEPVTKPQFDRRKSKEERRGAKKPRGPYDMRSGRDRRKNSGGPGVDLKV